MYTALMGSEQVSNYVCLIDIFRGRKKVNSGWGDVDIIHWNREEPNLYNTFENSLFKFMIVIDLSFIIVIDCWIILCSVLIPKYLNKRR